MLKGERKDPRQASQAAKMITNGAIEFSFPYHHTLDRDLEGKSNHYIIR
jgi:hypothetical protein